MSLLIIADDLSGAADCAIGFACAGRRTVVTLDSTRAPAGASAFDVIAADTDTRRASLDAAARLTVDTWRALGGPDRRLYKKIDSTLRGNWAAEIAALQPLAGLAIVAPAFPAMGRTVRGGRVFVHGQPLETTDTWQLENAGKHADIAGQLEGVGLSTAALEGAALRAAPAELAGMVAAYATSGIQALIVDAQTGEDLAALARATVSVDEALFWVGSGGLAREMASLSRLFSVAQEVPDRSEALTILSHGGPILALVGTLSAVSDEQCATLRERGAVAELIASPDMLRAGAGHAQWHTMQARIGAHLATQGDLLLRIGRDDAFDPAEGAQLSAALGRLVAPHFGKIGGLIATGGETARAMLRETGIDFLQLVTGIEPGVAIGQPLDAHQREGRAHRPGVVTKAGAFGDGQSLYAAWRHLRDAIPA